MNESPTTENSPLRLARLDKSYRKKKVLDKLDLNIAIGSVVGLLGKNGAGKTTLIKCALGLMRPDSGEATIFGKSAWTLDAETKARLGYVPQSVSLYSWMRIGQLVDYTAAFYPKWNAALVGDLLRDWELKADDKAGNLSVGTQQKLAIILAMGHEPDLLVLDEPAASLDPIARRQFLKAVLAVASDQTRTVVFSTHITSDLERVADRLALLRDGRIVYDGELDELKDSVKRWHVTAAGALPADLDVPGAVHRRIEGAEALLTVRGGTQESREEIERRYSASVRVEDLSLEDLFLELHEEEVQHAETR